MKRQIVEAGAGCGKTYSLVSRYISALGFDPESGKRLNAPLIHPKNIICLTFTDLASKEMLERILLRLKNLNLNSQHDEVLSHSQISTFHSFCYKIIAPYLPKLGYKSTQIESESWVQTRRETWVRESLFKHPLRNELLSEATLSQIIEWTCDTWFDLNEFSEINALNSITEIKNSYNEVSTLLKTELESFSKKNTKALLDKEDSWPSLLLRYFNGEKDLIHLINFKKDTNPSFKKEVPDLYLMYRSFVNFIKEGKEELLNESHSQRELSFLKNLSQFQTDCRKIAAKYLDFSALEYEMLHLLRDSHSDFWSSWTAPELLIVDEFQDTNHSQLEILERLSGENSSWYFVGDPKQSIYSFRAARIEIFTSLTKKLEHLKLSKNYRSEKPLLEYLNAFQDSLFTDSESDPPPQSLSPALEGSSLNKAIRYWTTQKAHSIQWTHVLEAFKKRSGEAPQATHAFLFLKWRDLYHYAQFLEETSLPFQILGKESYLDHHLSSLFCLYLELVEDPNYKVAQETLKQWGFKFGSTPRIEKRLTEIFLDFVKDLAPGRWLKGAEWTGAMERLLYSFEEEKISLNLSLSDLSNFIRKLSERYTTESPTQPSDAYPLNTPLLLTVHASKGLEFDHVYLPKLYERRSNEVNSDGDELSVDIKFFNATERKELASLLFLKKKRFQYRIKESEMKRVFYVALTRAKKSLDLFYTIPKDKSIEADPFTIFRWPEKNNTSWPKILHNLNHLECVEEIKLENTEEDETKSPKDILWQLPMPQRPDSKEKPFFWGGVSEYLKQKQEIHEKSENTFQQLNKQNDFGNKLHALLEIWNGNPTEIESLLDPEDPDSESLKSALHSLYNISEIREFFDTLSKDQSKICRELALMISTPEACLSGVADAVYLRNDDEWWILDWKTSSSLFNLQKEDRLSKINEQLDLYAHSFKHFKKRLRVLAIAINPGPAHSQKASILIDRYI